MHERVRQLKQGPETKKTILYWMFRDQRTEDNWALLFAQEKGLSLQVPVHVIVCLNQFPLPSRRQQDFVISGLKETESALRAKNISFTCLAGNPAVLLPNWIQSHKIGCLVTDFSPLRLKQEWNRQLLDAISIPFYEVDAHNIVPCWLASPKQEYAAYTFRPKIHHLLKHYLNDFPKLRPHPYGTAGQTAPVPWDALVTKVTLNEAARPVHWLYPGSEQGYTQLLAFFEDRLANYSATVNNPAADGQSQLSPYLHFGQLAAQRVVLELLRRYPLHQSAEKFLEQIVVRRELADNYCYYNPNYDQFAGFPSWSQDTLLRHTDDVRPYLYAQTELEQGLTHDPLWNAAQLEMVTTGKMNGYLRMYWAKKILEWTENPREALRLALQLNDLYELDGNDPIGYANIAWCIGGVHDRPWPERPIFGKIRYMNYNGMRRKFDINAYINNVTWKMGQEQATGK
ncbi:MAG: deoxyribodipyrimidine photolyase [Firmicutes bacterium]|nr:deoxyribodipyrimidine photolyase [Bacillota bacterium]